MHPRLLEYFSQELLYMREGAAEFARMHPGAAAHLGIGAPEVADPYVERLIEAFCLLSARTRIKLDAEFPRFADRLLEVLHPHFLAPMPAMGVARLRPRHDDRTLDAGVLVPAHTRLWSNLEHHADTPVEWRSSAELRLWPLELAEARLEAGVPELGRASRGLPAQARLRGCLRLRLRTLGEWRLRDLHGLDSLRIHLAGDLAMGSRLFELLHRSFAACAVRAPQAAHGAGEFRLLEGEVLAYEGMHPEAGLLPLRYNTLRAHNLLQEYFHAPQCLYEFTLRGLAKALGELDAQAVDLYLLLEDAPPDLCAWVDAGSLALFCTPVINLFEARTDRVHLSEDRSEYQLLGDRSRPLDHEVWAVEQLEGHRRGTSDLLCFRPLYQTLHRDGGDHGRYFAVRRAQRAPSDAVRRWGARSSYVGTEVFVSLVDQFEAPLSVDMDQISVRAWLTNRDLPLWIGGTTPASRALSVEAAVASAELLRAPSPPRPPVAMESGAWNLIRLLGMHHLPLAELDGEQAAQALRELLSLFVRSDDADALRRIEALRAARMACTTRRLPVAGPLVFGRALECELELDDEAFAPGSPLLLAMVLDRVLAQYVSINSCSRVSLHSVQRGALWAGPLRMGTQGVI
ncbi:type VI secretion system baseplate subunit TssF [Thiomonas sp. FB-6]|uniref:type VI secretion system baseplate subunit TssF n=1 Tax=Thiomonas sp. FB-6 TaxID=1158291 RepID=UPI00036A8381|nr:type VI secretion system baseplate subunit TssF [Thiomonas sp. FB-6]